MKHKSQIIAPTNYFDQLYHLIFFSSQNFISSTFNYFKQLKLHIFAKKGHLKLFCSATFLQILPF